MRRTITHVRSSGLEVCSPNAQEREFLDRASRGEFTREMNGLDLRGKVAGKVFSYIDGEKILHWVDNDGMSRLIHEVKMNRGVYTRAIKEKLETKRAANRVSSIDFF